MEAMRWARAGLLVCTVLVQSCCCCDKKTSYYCSACLADHGCKYCSPLARYDHEAGGKTESKRRLCRLLVGVPGTGVPTADEAACLAAPAAKFEVTCTSHTKREPHVPIKVESERETPRYADLAGNSEEVRP